LGTLYVRPKDDVERSVLENPEYAAQILEEANIKKLALIGDETALVKVKLRPDAKKLGPRAGKNLRTIAQALERAEPQQIAKGGTHTVEIEGQPFELSPDEILISFEGPENLKCLSEQGSFLALDVTLEPELLQEGIARDFNRLLQDQRKALGLNISDRIVVNYYTASQRIVEAISAHEEYLRTELLAERLEASATHNGGTKLLLSGEEIFVTITRA
jgi:isoleucyl-tRNA synthetase